MREWQLPVPMPHPLRLAVQAQAQHEGRSEADVVRRILTAVLLDPPDRQEASSDDRP
jgi:hypothetical protein